MLSAQPGFAPGSALVADDTVAITLMDGRGAFVGRIDSLALLGVSPSQLRMSAAADDALYATGLGRARAEQRQRK